ncbi:MAG: hypothetical protein K0S07_130, partial [Chlamydiales bacterium]|nr:hypothetical protein [Chlamydiales bacterium]
LIERINNIVWYAPIYVKIPLFIGSILTLPVTFLLGNIYLAADFGQLMAQESMRHMPQPSSLATPVSISVHPSSISIDLNSPIAVSMK